MFINSGIDIGANNDIKTVIKINDKGKTLGPFDGDKLGDPLEKIGWGRKLFDNINLTKCNLKAYPLVFDKNFRLKIHPKYLTDENVIHECVAANAYLSQRTESHFTDDTFFTGELIRAILSIFARTDINFDQKCILAAMKFHENLKNFAAKNGGMLEECGTNTKNILLGQKPGGPSNDSNRNGCAMRIPLVGIFANSLSELWKIVLASIRNTHYHEHSFDAARSVASIVFLAREDLGQNSMAKFINLEFKNKYTKLFEQYDKEQRKQLGYHNQNHFFDFNMDNLSLQSVYNDRLFYKYAETALDTVVVALRIVRVAGSFYEACVLAKAYGGDSDTLLAIVLAMAAVVFGVPQEIQNETKKQLKIQTSEELKSYVQLSDEMDKQFSNQYPENISLEKQLKQTYNTIVEIIKNEERDIETINKSIGFNGEVDKIIYSNSSPKEFSWDRKPWTFLFCFVLTPIILFGIAFYLLSSKLVLVAFLTICILDFIAFRVITKAMVKAEAEAFFSEKEKLALKKSNASPTVEKLQSEISINNALNINDDVLNIGNEVTKSDAFKQLIKSIVEDWNFNLDPNKKYDKNQREYFAYEPDGKQPEFKKEDYDSYLNTLRKYKTSNEAKLKESTEKLTGSDQRLTKLRQSLKTLKMSKQELELKADKEKLITGANNETISGSGINEIKETKVKTIKKIEGQMEEIKRIEEIKKQIEETEEQICEIETEKGRKSEILGIIQETERQITDAENLKAQGMHNAYISEEKALYQEINAHNKATAEFKTQKKIEKLKNLTPEQLKQISAYVSKINQIAEKYGIEDKINFNEEKLSDWPGKNKEKMDIIPWQEGVGPIK